MSRNPLTRSAVIGATALAVLGFAAAPAAAADRYIGSSLGSMTHIDDGDDFKVCDNKADGHGVTGYLKERRKGGLTITTVLTVDDGGDSGCDVGSYDILSTHEYIMVLTWNGEGGNTVTSSWFSE
ncbi:hypothetical protein [Glycomyces paridis]|uniref:Uncharacterized protein n=1 Tax=Glycomyces paridis TaxID=2126555 RepID=A0A4S8PHZ2_9ACTN|nr:hypothetical protein [Glycomyces paridis]THV30200.1 hypothetical protein E9998_07460 [Glycomyces paridis]